MFVSDIFDDAKEVLGFCSENKIYSRLNDAVEVLANKGQWDSLLTYLVINNTGSTNIIQVPPDVDAVLRLNINGNPSFARDRMYEFTLDGPGSNDARLGFQWEDRGDILQEGQIQGSNNTTSDAQGVNQLAGESPTTIPAPPYMSPAGAYNETFPMTVTIYSRDTLGGFVIYTTDGSDPTWTHGVHAGRSVMLTLSGETTLKAVVARAADQISTITTEFYTNSPAPGPPPPAPPPPAPPPPSPPPASQPRTRYIRISQQAVSVRALVRLKPRRISGIDDWIPLDSKMAILLMLKSLESYRKGTPQDFQLGQGQEEQALKFLQEEQKSRNVFSEIAQTTDSPPLVGYTYHANNVVIVADIYDEACAICKGVGQAHIFDRISEAVEVLSNKGQWDGMTFYMDMTPSSNIVGLPSNVEIPIRINIEHTAAFPRNRMFEFSTNGPGDMLDDVNLLTWDDLGTDTLMVPLTTPSPISFAGLNTDTGVSIVVTGVDSNDRQQTITYGVVTAPGGIGGSHPTVWKTITRISKPVTTGPVSVYANSALVAFLYPTDTEASFRIIKLSKAADNIKIMFRKSSLKITSINDLIPLKSRSAILLMLRALEIYKSQNPSPETLATAQQLESQSIKFMQEEESSRLAYIQASMRDQLPAFGITTNSRGVITVAEIYDDACEIFGPIGRHSILDKITESMEMLANKSQWDGLDGYVDIITDQRGYMTLPRKVEIPLGVNFWRIPAQMRSRWYEFHMNGLGTDPVRGYFWDDLAESPLAFEPTQAVRLFASTDVQADSTIKIRAFGYDSVGQWIRSIENDQYVDGELVPVNVISLSSSTVKTTNSEFAQVTRVTKEESSMPIQLFGGATVMLPISINNAPSITPPNPQFLAIYESSEVEPMFRRIRIPTWVTWARMRFRTSTLKMESMRDPLYMRSKTAIITMMRALKALSDGKLQDYAAMEDTAVKLLSEEQQSRNPAETFMLQYDTHTSWADPLQGQY